ncbi:hypothetical protein A2526_03320 [candidate division WOR-1 bacterium RIFOXYD2_FULL_36_8]|uniref:Uncharacterized protein n=1 Tax=candidate division WOR-1 bacterium RIFOXYB2_FULL_36_35 TaxID=1802578 RepID=A0A1F4RZX5_UNCSA|nr:MAG: hypothetical protein A2230_00245 [candidate division WOR-1 bacterium RIFOXYA2_FULL_36_21]OGC13738.1 MAG: hypothetical protein A2290_07685 [candidate division WOR-1 bacterium RIFOXYB2_FULL_36_35]OGC16982.1 MAG: hypothetical protein A2282_06245 [candidate division WOR-1 bacterium RIFOXYA12_FULL_36_13]OGC41782.1 MAG: hypothetical protein A2526_03320 [candidate division WOR-1 bacterium RIFOXYD2_FULL_36_8]
MRFEIDEEHFTVTNLLILLISWSNTCYLLVLFLRSWLPVLISTLLIITGLVLTVAMVIITIYVSIRWIKHHKLGLWVLIGIVILFIISWSFEATVKKIFFEQQVYEYDQVY